MRRLVGDTMPLALDANDGYTTGGAIRVSRALEELGYWWFDQTRPMIGHMANLHVAASLLHGVKPVEWDDPSTRTHAVFDNLPVPVDGLFHLPTTLGLV